MTQASSSVRKRSVSIAGHRTSLSLEQPFWDALKRLAAAEGLSVNGLVEKIDRERGTDMPGNLSSMVRIHVLEQLQAAAETKKA